MVGNPVCYQGRLFYAEQICVLKQLYEIGPRFTTCCLHHNYGCVIPGHTAVNGLTRTPSWGWVTQVVEHWYGNPEVSGLSPGFRSSLPIFQRVQMRRVTWCHHKPSTFRNCSSSEVTMILNHLHASFLWGWGAFTKDATIARDNTAVLVVSTVVFYHS